MGMYDQVRSEQERKRDSSKITLIIVATLLMVAVLMTIIGYPVYLSRKASSFLEDFSAGTVYAYENDSLRAEVDGVSTRVNGEEIYNLYRLISMLSYGNIKFRTPDGEKIFLDYGDGSTMEIWTAEIRHKDYESVDLFNPGRDIGVFIRFTSPEGRRYSIETNRFTYDDFAARVGAGRNPLWNE